MIILLCQWAFSSAITSASQVNAVHASNLNELSIRVRWQFPPITVNETQLRDVTRMTKAPTEWMGIVPVGNVNNDHCVQLFMITKPIYYQVIKLKGWFRIGYSRWTPKNRILSMAISFWIWSEQKGNNSSICWEKTRMNLINMSLMNNQEWK